MSSETVRPTKRGRPRTFDEDELLDSTIDTFWKHGLTGATTRVLEGELGVSQSSLYNAFGSKEELLDVAVARYEQRLQSAVLAKLENPGRQALLEFLDAVSDWVSHEEHRGCLVMNLAAENAGHSWRLDSYRIGLFDAIKACLETFIDRPGDVDDRTDLLVAAVLGMNVSAKCGAEPHEIRRTSDAIKNLIASW